MHNKYRGCTDFLDGTVNKSKEGKNLCLDQKMIYIDPDFHRKKVQ
jgi:hypothetical protein